MENTLIARSLSILAIAPISLGVLFFFPDANTRLALLTALFIVSAQILDIGIISALVYVAVGVVAAVGGGIASNLCPETWRYAQRQVWGLPFWLVPLWACAALMLRAVGTPGGKGLCTVRVTVECGGQTNEASGKQEVSARFSA
jgi:hypothetical protein